MAFDMNNGFVRNPVTGALAVDLSATTIDIGAVKVEDATVSAQKLKVLADGSINVNSTPGVEVATAASGGANPALFKAMGGSDGTNLRPIKTDTSGVLQVDLAAPIPAGANNIGIVTLSSGIDVTDRVARQLGVISGTVTSNQGTAAGTSSAWPTKVSDGTNVAAVKAASTAPVGADPALVVVMSPNAPVQPVSLATAPTTPVTGTFWQATQPVSGTVTANQGTAAAASSAWPAKVTDGTNTAAVKPASTAAAAADPSLVVTVHPSSGPTTTQPVSGTFWQATQPVSGTVTSNQGTANTAANAWPAKVTDGTNTATVKPASTAAVAGDSSLAVTIHPTSGPTATQPVSGTFWQATQPVSLATNTPDVTDRAARLLGVATLPADTTSSTTISAAGQAVTVTVPAGGRSVHFNASGSPFSAGTTIVFEGTYDGTNWFLLGATYRVGTTTTVGTQMVGAGFNIWQWEANCAGLNSVRARCSTYTALDAPVITVKVSQADIGSMGGMPTVVGGPITKGNAVIGNPVRIGGTDGSNNAQDIAVTTKGTQGAFGVGTQDLKDSGRALVTYYMLIPVLATATDTLQSLTGTKGGATVTATTTPAVVTAAKTFRIQQFSAIYIATATSGYGVVRLRYNTGGVVAITSPVLETLVVGSDTPATANAGGAPVSMALADGLEVPAGTGVGISVQGFAAAVATAVGFVHCSVSGYEY